ncbi:MAG: ribonuclease protein component [Chloroflexota bacterium]|jgi:ribonuclease P protein component
MLRTPADFAALSGAPSVAVRRLGIRHRTDAARAVDPTAPRLRIGIATSRKVGGAVVRNRIRRRLKAIVHELAPQVSPGSDILFGVRTAAAGATTAELRADVQECLRRARLLHDGEAAR